MLLRPPFTLLSIWFESHMKHCNSNMYVCRFAAAGDIKCLDAAESYKVVAQIEGRFIVQRKTSVTSQAGRSRLTPLELLQLLLVPIRGLGATVPRWLVIVTISNRQLLIFLHSPHGSDALDRPKTRVDKPAQTKKKKPKLLKSDKKDNHQSFPHALLMRNVVRLDNNSNTQT